MQFLPSSYLGYPSNTSSAQPGLTYALDQQQQQHQQQQQQPTATALSYPSSNMQHGFPAESYAPQPTTAAAAAPATTENNAQGKPKRKQVKNACVNCQKACKKCDDARPCPRCIKYGIAATCVNSVRKERKKGVKRGPYKQRKNQGEGNTATKASEPNTPVPTPLSSLTSPMGNNVQLFNHANPYVRSFHGSGDGYQPGALLQSYAAFPGILQGMYAHPYHAATQNHHQQQQLPQQQQQQPPSVKAEQQQSQAKAKETSGTTDSDEEGSKLTILSQLCSAVLDHSDAPQKQEPQQRYNDTAAKNPLLSHPSAQTYNASVSSSMTTYPNYATNGTRPNIVYGTPISDTSNAPSPIPHPQHPIYASVNHHQQQTAQQQQQPQQQMWPLPSLQSVVSSDRMYYQQHPLQHNQPGSNDNTTNHWNGANPPHW